MFPLSEQGSWPISLTSFLLAVPRSPPSLPAADGLPGAPSLGLVPLPCAPGWQRYFLLMGITCELCVTQAPTSAGRAGATFVESYLCCYCPAT